MSTLNGEMKAVYNRHERNKNRLMREIAEAVLNHAKVAFDEEGFTGISYKRWKERKHKREYWPILNKTGKLSTATRILYVSYPKFVVTNQVKYADFHNDGTARLPKRQFLSKGYGEDSPVLDRKIDKIVDRHAKFVAYGH